MASPIRPNLPETASSVLGFITRLLGRVLRIRAFWIFAAIAALAIIGPASLTGYVPPNQVGVRQTFYGSSAGIQKQLYGPGLHIVLSGVERMHLFPRDVQVLDFSESSSEASYDRRTAPSIRIQTSDGYNVQLDVTVLYRIEDAYHVFTEAGPGRAYESRLVIPNGDRILRKTLGELNSEEFYQGPRRIEKATSAYTQLVEALKPFGISVDAVLVRRYEYDPRYQQLIEGRKIKDQTVFLRQAETKAAIEQRKRDTTIAEGAATQKVELSRGEAEVSKITAQADLYRRKRAAEGRLLVELAEAQGTRLENDALQGAGSENFVGLRMAEVFKGVRVLVLPSDGANGTNPLDVAATLRKLEVK